MKEIKFEEGKSMPEKLVKKLIKSSKHSIKIIGPKKLYECKIIWFNKEKMKNEKDN